MPSIYRPRARFKPPEPQFTDHPQLAVDPEDTIPYLETLQEIINVTREINRLTEVCFYPLS